MSAAAERKGFFARLRDGLSRTAGQLGESITALVTKRPLDDALLTELEETLIAADLGVATAGELVSSLRRQRFGKEVAEQEIRTLLAEAIEKILTPHAVPFAVDETRKPFVVLVAGVNGAGKTTSIGKLAAQLTREGKRVWLAAGDTFRAAAVEQLKVWGERAGCPVIAKDTGADAAGLAFEALQQAKAAGADVLLLDTAGRLQNKTELMAELQKIVRVLKKQDDAAPHACLLVLDATVGQNAHSQVALFSEMVPVTGLVVTKLDGTARGGVVVSLAARYGTPISFIGIGESIDDLRPFTARDFARSLLGLEENA